MKPKYILWILLSAAGRHWLLFVVQRKGDDITAILRAVAAGLELEGEDVVRARVLARRRTEALAAAHLAGGAVIAHGVSFTGAAVGVPDDTKHRVLESKCT